MSLFGIALLLVSSPLVAVLAYGTYVSIFEDRTPAVSKVKARSATTVAPAE